MSLMSLSNVENDVVAEDVQSVKDEDKEDMEEGELLEEGELSDAGDSAAPRPIATSPQQNSKQKSPVDHHRSHNHSSISSSSHHGGSNKKEKSSSKEKASPSHNKDVAGKKRKHEQQQHNNAPITTMHETKSVSNDDVNDVEAFLKKKKLELAEKVKHQLRLAGVEARVESGDESEPECIKPDSKNGRPNATAGVVATKRSSVCETAPSSSGLVPKYYDLDKVEDVGETMLSNWSRGKAQADKLKAPSPTSANFDPLEEYYQSSSIADTESLKQTEQDFRFNNNAATTVDQDYRFGTNYDVDYRRKPGAGDAEFASPSDIGSEGGAFSEEENAANEFGDIDERHRPTTSGSSKRLRGRRGGLRNKKPRQYDESGSDEEDDGERAERHVRRGPRPDIRGGRRRSRSPIRRRGGLMRMGDRNGNEMPICKFYRDGYCREGDSCNYSHDLEPQRTPDKKAELCKFYMNGFCRNGKRCPFMHGEYPCKFYHKGECTKGDDCRYSHDMLNEVTRPIFDRMLKDEELASKVSVPDAPSRRKVLLGSPPKMGPPPPINGPHPCFNPHASELKQQSGSFHSNSPQEPGFSGQSSFNSQSGAYSDMYSGGSPPQPPLKDLSNNDDKRNNEGMSDGKVTIDIAAMLRQIKADVTGGEVQESPASPEPCGEASVAFYVVRQPSNWPEYRLISIDLPPRDVSSNATLIQASLADPKLGNDPRIKKLLSSQFDAVSDMISSQTNATKERKDAASPNQRSAPLNVRDPRIKTSTNFMGPGTSPQHHQTPAANIMDANAANMMYGTMYAQQPMNFANPMNMPNMPNMPSMNSMPNFVPPGQMPNPMQMPNNPMIMNAAAMFAAGNQQQSSNMASNPMMNMPQMMPPMGMASNWMPQVNNNGNQPQWMPPSAQSQQSPIMNPNQQDLQRFNGPMVVVSQQPQFGGPALDVQSKDPRARRNIVNRSFANTEPRQYSPPNQTTSPDNRDFSTAGSGASESLREKRKNLEYESPLNAVSGVGTRATGDENRYNYSGSIKLKKKDSVED